MWTCWVEVPSGHLVGGFGPRAQGKRGERGEAHRPPKMCRGWGQALTRRPVPTEPVSGLGGLGSHWGCREERWGGAPLEKGAWSGPKKE